MNRSKKLYLLLGILLVVCAATFGVCKYEEKKEQIKNSDEIILELASEDVTSLSWEYESEELAFHKEENWICDEDDAFPVSEEKINELLELFEEFGVSFIIEEVEDYGQYGLDDPVCTINIGTEEETYEILLGDYSTMDSERYVSIGDGNVYLVKEDPLESFELTLSDMIDNDEIPDFAKGEVEKIQFEGDEKYQVVYEDDNEDLYGKDTYCEEDVYFTKRDGNNCPLDTSRIEDYLDAVSSLDQTEYVTYNASDEDLEKYGLDDPELTVSVEYIYTSEEDDEEKKDTFVLHIARDPEEAKKAESKSKESDKEEDEDNEEEEITAYARVGESKIIYQIPGDQYTELINASYNDLRHREIISAEFTDINKIEISLEGKDYTITSKGKDEKKTWYYGEEELETEDFENALKALEADSFTEEDPEGKEEISLTIYLDMENDPKITIELYRYDGSYCLAVVDGEPVSLVERTQVVDLMEAVNAIVLN